MSETYDWCERCNYDRHICPGCGDNLPHGIKVCAVCEEEIRKGER